MDRPALDRLRDAVAQGESETVVILSPDRSARQLAYQYILLKEFARVGAAQEHACGSLRKRAGYSKTLRPPEEGITVEVPAISSRSCGSKHNSK